MGLTQNHALGRNRKFFAVAEVTAGTPVKPAATDAAKVLKSTFTLEQARDPRTDSRATRSLLERITGKGKVSWTIDSYCIPSGTAGTPPDLHPLYYAALGGYANSPGTSDTYSLADTQPFRTCSLYHEYSAVLSELIYGAWVDELKITASGGDVPKVSFTGGAMGFVPTGTSTLNGAMVGSATMVAQTADAYNFNKYSIVKVGSSDNSGLGYQVTVDTARPSYTLETTLSASTSDPVIPFLPAETTAGNPINGISGSITIDTVAHIITSFDISVKNNIKAFEDEAFAQFPTDGVPMWREVKGSVSFRARKDYIITLNKRAAFGTHDLAITLGSAVGKRCKVNVDYAEWDFSAVDIPETDEAVITLPFTALGSSGADECNIVFD